MEEKITMDYSKMSPKAMVDYIKANETDATVKAEFKKALNPHTEKNAEGKEAKKFNTKEGKKWFYNHYKNVIDFKNPPKTKAKSTWDELMSW